MMPASIGRQARSLSCEERRDRHAVGGGARSHPFTLTSASRSTVKVFPAISTFGSPKAW